MMGSIRKPILDGIMKRGSGDTKMTLERKISEALKMDDEAWMKHANP